MRPKIVFVLLSLMLAGFVALVAVPDRTRATQTETTVTDRPVEDVPSEPAEPGPSSR